MGTDRMGQESWVSALAGSVALYVPSSLSLSSLGLSFPVYKRTNIHICLEILTGISLAGESGGVKTSQGVGRPSKE